MPLDPFASCQLISTAITAGASRVASGLLCLHAVAITPAGSMELVRSFISTVSGLPCVTVRSAPAPVLSGPAQRSLTLRPARSPSRLATLYIESSDSFVASTAASIATGWSEPVPGRELHPLKSSAFHGALLRQLTHRLLEYTLAWIGVYDEVVRPVAGRGRRCRSDQEPALTIRSVVGTRPVTNG